MISNYRRKPQSLNNKCSTKTPNIDFYQNNTKIPSNRLTLKDIHQKKKQDYQWLQKCHDYIQWLFPTFHKSKFNINSFPLTQNQAIIFQKSRVLGQKLMKSFEIYCNFIGLTIIINPRQDKNPNVNESNIKINYLKLNYVIDNHQRLVDALKIHIHNHLRIKRIISCLCSTGFKTIAIEFVQMLNKAIDLNKTIKKDEQLCNRLRYQWSDCLAYNNEEKLQINPFLICQQNQHQYIFSKQKQLVKNVLRDIHKDKQFSYGSNIQMKNSNNKMMNESRVNKMIKQKDIKIDQKLLIQSRFNNNKSTIQQSQILTNDSRLDLNKRSIANRIKSSTTKQQNKNMEDQNIDIFS